MTKPHNIYVYDFANYACTTTYVTITKQWETLVSF